MKVVSVFSPLASPLEVKKTNVDNTKIDWKGEIWKLAKDFCISKKDYKHAVDKVVASARETDTDLILYERLHRKIMDLI